MSNQKGGIMEEHHTWCNHYMNPVEGCEMCARLNESYPMEGLSSTELIKKHFPDAVVRNG